MNFKKYQLVSSILVSSILVSISIPISSLAAVSYSRFPSGTSIASPVTFTVSFGSASDIEGWVNDQYWCVITGVTGGDIFARSPILPISTLTWSGALTAPAGAYTFVDAQTQSENNCTDYSSQGYKELEGNGQSVIFVIPGAVGVIPPTIFNKDLSLGDVGDDIKILQAFLAGDSAIYPEGLVTGYFGELTKKAVENFQIKYGIVSSGTSETTGFGRVGPKTRAKLNEIINVR